LPVRSKRLWGPTTVGVSGAVLYTVPAGETALVKTISIVNTFAVNNNFSLYLGTINPANLIFEASIDEANSLLLPGLFIVAHPGETIRGQAGNASCIVAGFGAELEGVAD